MGCGSGTYFGVDPRLDMIYIMMEQTQGERARTRVAFRKLVYDAFAAGQYRSLPHQQPAQSCNGGPSRLE